MTSWPLRQAGPFAGNPRFEVPPALFWLLLSLNAVVPALHLLLAGDGSGTAPFLDMANQRGLSARIELLQMSSALCLAVLAASRQGGSAAWLAVASFAILLATEAGDLHIRLAEMLRRRHVEAAGLAAASAMGGLSLGLALLARGLASDRHERRFTSLILSLIALFLCLGGGLDLAGKHLPALRPPLVFLEELAELWISAIALLAVTTLLEGSCGALPLRPFGARRQSNWMIRSSTWRLEGTGS